MSKSRRATKSELRSRHCGSRGTLLRSNLTPAENYNGESRHQFSLSPRQFRPLVAVYACLAFAGCSVHTVASSGISNLNRPEKLTEARESTLARVAPLFISGPSEQIEIPDRKPAQDDQILAESLLPMVRETVRRIRAFDKEFDVELFSVHLPKSTKFSISVDSSEKSRLSILESTIYISTNVVQALLDAVLVESADDIRKALEWDGSWELNGGYG